MGLTMKILRMVIAETDGSAAARWDLNEQLSALAPVVMVLDLTEDDLVPTVVVALRRLSMLASAGPAASASSPGKLSGDAVAHMVIAELLPRYADARGVMSRAVRDTVAILLRDYSVERWTDAYERRDAYEHRTGD